MADLDGFIPELVKANHFREAKKPTGFGQELLRRARSGTPRSAEVTVKARVFKGSKASDLGAINVIETDATEIVQGLSFWTKDLAIERAKRLLDEAKQLADIVRGANWAIISHEEVVTLNDRAIHLETCTRNIKKTIDLCRSFLTAPNLHRAQMAFDQRSA
jgi:hypothetical protein